MDLATVHADVLRLIPDRDWQAFAGQPERIQGDVLERLGWIHRIDNAGHGRKGQVVQAAAIALGVSPGSVNRYLDRYRRHGWRGLRDGRARGLARKASDLPEPFKAWIRTLFLQAQRATTGKEVQRQAVERWHLWRRTADPDHAIPGYTQPPAPGPGGIPHGWSVDTILRLRPDDYALATARQGAKSAAKFLPSILKTRVGVKFGQVVFFDDQDYDNKVVAPGMSGRTLRPQGFNALDYLSACFMEYSIRLRWWDGDANKHRSLTGIDYTWFQITYLQRHGYRTDEEGTILVEEHGTAKGYDNRDLETPGGQHSLADALEAVTGGKVRTIRSGLWNQPAFAGMLLRPSSSGNPNFKAPLEGIFNLVRNRGAMLPGAIGSNARLNGPEEAHGRDKYDEQLLKVWDALDDNHRRFLTFMNPTAEQFGAAYAGLYSAINSRREHDIEGWDRCGHVAPLFRWTTDGSSPWLSQEDLLRLPEKQRAAADALMELDGHVKPIRLCPAEVAQIHAHELTRLPDHFVPLLIPVQWAREVKVKPNRTVSIQDQLMGPEALQFVARFETQDGAHLLGPGTRLRAYLNPFDTSRLIVCRADGSFLGALPAINRSAFLDSRAIEQQLHERAAMKADMDAAVRPHLEGLIRHRQQADATNRRLAAGEPVTPEEMRDARSSAGRKAHRTAAANRLQSRGKRDDFDEFEPDSPGTVFDSLPDDDEIPDAF